MGLGDRVQLYVSNGHQVLEGIVERIEPLRTIIRTDDALPMAIPNKVLTALLTIR